MSISIPVAWGELIDKISILEIKLDKLMDAKALANVRRDYEALCLIRDQSGPLPDELQDLTREILAVNKRLWKIEDTIRACERTGDFGPDFIQLARAVYITNDKRAALKRQVNVLMNSMLYEEKSYTNY